MAEAHQAIGVFEEHKRGVELLYSDQGLRVSFTIPPPWRIRQAVVRSAFHMERAIKRRVYPAPPIAAVLIMVGAIVMVLISPSESWWRSSLLSHFVWNVGNTLIPFSSYIPKSLYLAYLAGWTAFLGLLILMWGQRLILRGLLSYRGWLYLGPREKSNVVLAWGGLLKILSGINPLTYSYQDALPRLPVPPLKDTVSRFLKSVHPLLSEEEYKEMEQQAADFLKKDGPKLQWYLYLKSWWSNNYVTDWWEKYVYLRGRTSLMINSNYYGLPPRNFDFLLSRNQAAVAAVYTRLFMLFKQDLDREQLPVMLIRGIVPLCMSQYQRMFSCTRVPGREEDELKTYQSKHIAVLCKGRFFKMPLFEKGEHGKLLSFHEMQRQFESILATAESMGEPTTAEKHLAALTAVGRIEWAEIREKYFSEGTNKRSLEVVESAVFVVTLQDDAPPDCTAMGRDLIHGNGSNRWFDKSFNLVVYNNGLHGFNAEHSWADAPAMAHAWEWTITKEVIEDPYLPDGNTKCVFEKEKSSVLPACKALKWDIATGVEHAIMKSHTEARLAIEDFDLEVIGHEDYGKGLIKKFRVSPDGFIQMALQLAYYRNQGTITQTYESSMTRLYRDGRTETVRPVTDESKEFVLAMVSETATREEKLKALQKACDIHQDGYRNAMSGKGVDRHLFTLYCTSVGFGIESPFLKSALGRPWRLSTSQQPQQQTPHWKDVEKALTGSKWTPKSLFSLGGGFGPVAEDGYGVSYMIGGEDLIGFHISSKKSCAATGSKKFAEDLFQAFKEMKELIVQA
ncbi:hypothetical protein Poli38472_012796 [Pythium oligandrum]|uniref:Choline/carnitine acyltransferase domain-containing protein n=1 Tax=Pythium oligandrum TaxID=41045 RepID=A0A8K1FFF8_PYTOL|nr:hypothetical protein Poli38472_012796 [Pythium oligandrum]|eukprot:TMW61605.1 hypothetical protein Poli38472_012796 [Pythium oligandrum]